MRTGRDRGARGRLTRVLHLRQLRRRPVRTGLAVLSMGAAVSLAIGVLVSAQSITGSIDDFGRQLAGPTALRVVGSHARGGLGPDVLTAVRAVPGVAVAVPIIQTVALVADGVEETPLLVLGVDCTVEQLVGAFGCDPATLESVADETPPLIGTSLRAELAAGATLRSDVGRIALDDALARPELDALNEGRVAVFSLSQAQRIFSRPGQFDAIYVDVAPGADVEEVRDRLAVAVGETNRVLTRDDPAAGLDAAGLVLPLLAMLGAASLAFGGVLVFNTMALSLAERRREIAVTAVLGARPIQILVGIIGEAVAIGCLGGLLGSGGAVLVARALVDEASEHTERDFGAVLSVHVNPEAVVIAMVVGGVVAGLAAFGPGLRASRIDVVEELRDRGARADDSRRLRWRGPALLTAVGGLGMLCSYIAQRDGALASWQPALGFTGVVLTIGSLFAAIGGWTPVLFSIASSIGRRRAARPGLVRLALANLANQPGRTGTVAAAVAGAVGLAVGLSNFIPANHDGVARTFGELADGRVHVATTPLTNAGLLSSRVPPSVVDALAAVPGVASVDRSYAVRTGSGDDEVDLGVLGGGVWPWAVLRGPGPAAVFAAGEVMVGPAFARSHDVGPGDAIEVATPTGWHTLRVGGVWSDPNNVGGRVTLPDDGTLERIWGPQPPDDVFVRPGPGIDAEALAARIRAAELDPGLRVRAPEEYTSALASEVDGYLDPFWLLQRALLLQTLVATMAVLLLAGAQRRREHAVLAAVGAGPRILTRITLLESGLLGATGSLLGVVASVGGVVVFVQVAEILFGLRPPFRLDLGPGVVYAVVGTVVVLLGAVGPARRVGRLEPVPILRSE